MRKIVHNFYMLVLLVATTSIMAGCTDFPDEYGVDVHITGMGIGDKVQLSEDGKSYTTTVRVHYEIQNSYKEISSAIVRINEDEYDVKGQLDPSTGGVVEIPCILKTNLETPVYTEVTIAGHKFESSRQLSPVRFSDKVTLATGKAEKITPFYAHLNVEANFPWLIDNNDIHMLISTESFNLPVTAKASGFNGKVVQCTLRAGADLEDYSVYCDVYGLNSNTTYYYQMVRMNSSDSSLVKVGETKSFKTTEVTAKITTSISDIDFVSATGNVTLDPGNLQGLYTTYANNKTTGGIMIWYIGKTLEELEASKGSTLGGGTTNIFYPMYFSGLEASTKYYYRCDFYIGEGFMCSSGVQEFSTKESTASWKKTNELVFDDMAMFDFTLDKGNVARTKYDTSTSGGLIYCGESIDKMERQQVVYDKESFRFVLRGLKPNTKYYYQIHYAPSGFYNFPVVGKSDVMEFTTASESAVTTTQVGEWLEDIQSSSLTQTFTIDVNEGDVLDFEYSANGRFEYEYIVKWTVTAGIFTQTSSIETIWNATFTKDSQGTVSYKFKRSGQYTLKFTSKYLSDVTKYPVHIDITNIRLKH